MDDSEMLPNVYPSRSDRHRKLRRHAAGACRLCSVRHIKVLVSAFMPSANDGAHAPQKSGRRLEELTQSLETFPPGRRPLVARVSADLGGQRSRASELSEAKGPRLLAQVAARSETASSKEQPVLVRCSPPYTDVERLVGEIDGASGVDVTNQPLQGGVNGVGGQSGALRTRMGISPAGRRVWGGVRANPGRFAGSAGVSIRALLWNVVAVGVWLVVMVGMYWVFDVLPLLLLFGVAIYYAVQSSGQARNREGAQR